jgi:hypothetical protein
MRQKQRGITFLGLVVVAGILVFGGIVGMQVFPTYIEFLAVQKAAKKAATGGTVPEVRSIFDKAAQIDDIRTVSGKDLEVSKQGEKVVVSFAYQREIHLGGPAYLLMKYQGSSR